MSSYDLVYIVKPDLDSEAIDAVVGRATQRLLDQGASIEHTESWGKRRMAYPIQRYREGHYVFLRFSVPGDRIPEIKRGLKIVEGLLRTSITVAIGPIAPPKPQAQPTPPTEAQDAQQPEPQTAESEPAAEQPAGAPEADPAGDVPQ